MSANRRGPVVSFMHLGIAAEAGEFRKRLQEGNWSRFALEESNANMILERSMSWKNRYAQKGDSGYRCGPLTVRERSNETV